MAKDILAMIAEVSQKTNEMSQGLQSVIDNTEKTCKKIRKIEVDTSGIRKAVAQGRAACQEMDRINHPIQGRVAQA